MAPMIELMKKDQFKWTEESEAIFQHMDGVMTANLVFALLDISQRVLVECDESG